MYCFSDVFTLYSVFEYLEKLTVHKMLYYYDYDSYYYYYYTIIKSQS